MLLVVTAAYVLLSLMIGHGLNTGATNINSILTIILLIGEIVGFCIYAISVIPGVGTIIGAVLICIICLVAGAGYKGV